MRKLRNRGGKMSAGVEGERHEPCQDAWQGEEPVEEIKLHDMIQQRLGSSLIQEHRG